MFELSFLSRGVWGASAIVAAVAAADAVLANCDNDGGNKVAD